MDTHTQEKLIEKLDDISSALLSYSTTTPTYNPDLYRITTTLENINSHLFLLAKSMENINMLAGYVYGRLLSEEEKSKAAATGGFE